MLNLSEFEGIVIDNVDPLAKGRLRVFVFGLHDLTGTKIPVSALPWAFSTYSSNITSIPERGTVVKVKFKVDEYGRNTYNPQYIEWYPTGHNTTLKNVKDPNNFISYDSENQKVVSSKTNYVSSNQSNQTEKDIAELEQQKKELEDFRDNNVEQLNQLIQEETNLNQTGIDKFLNEREIQQLPAREQELTTNYNLEKVRLEQRIASGVRIANITYANRGTDEQNLTLEQYANKINEKELEDLTNLDISYSASIREINQIRQNTADQINSSNVQLNRINNSKIAVQKEIDSLSSRIIEIDSQISQKRSSKPSGETAKNSFDGLSTSDNRITRIDEKTGKVYGKDDNGNEVLIGNWNGAFSYTPGYAGQPGEPIWKTKKNKRINENSNLSPVDPHALERGTTTANIASDNPSIKASDNDKTWNCDISYETRMKILTKRKEVMQAVKWLRDKILALFPIDGNSAISQWIKATAKHLTALLKNIQKFLKFINNVILEIAKLTAQIRQLINWILSLPARLLVLLQDCLTHFFNSIGDAFSESISLSGPGGPDVSFSEVGELVSQAQSTFQTATETVEATTIVYVEIKSIEATFEKA